jgi:hypothetical protein
MIVIRRLNVFIYSTKFICIWCENPSDVIITYNEHSQIKIIHEYIK